MVQGLSASSRAWNRWGLRMGQTASSCSRRFASSWPAMSSQATCLGVKSISLQTTWLQQVQVESASVKHEEALL